MDTVAQKKHFADKSIKDDIINEFNKNNETEYILISRKDLKNYHNDLWFLINWISDNAMDRLKVYKQQYREIKKRTEKHLSDKELIK